MPIGLVTIQTMLSREEMKPANSAPYLHSVVRQLTKRLGHFMNQRLITLILFQASVLSCRSVSHTITFKYHIFVNFPFRPQITSSFAEQNGESLVRGMGTNCLMGIRSRIHPSVKTAQVTNHYLLNIGHLYGAFSGLAMRTVLVYNCQKMTISHFNPFIFCPGLTILENN